MKRKTKTCPQCQHSRTVHPKAAQMDVTRLYCRGWNSLGSECFCKLSQEDVAMYRRPVNRGGTSASPKAPRA